MNSKDLIIHELQQAPDFLVEEVLDFLQFLKRKHSTERIEITVLSESSLSKDWLSQEEEEAWQDL
ncbi:MAG: DUF2281 domain-containing protein [Leptolyngbya sp.]|nr:MAG: DUF2281 domain-containing protein [Leptolyngbya sp.]